MPISDALEALCWSEAEAIQSDYACLRSCRVVIESVATAGRERYVVNVELALPGRELGLGRAAGDRCEHDDAGEAIRRAFAVMRSHVAAAGLDGQR